MGFAEILCHMRADAYVDCIRFRSCKPLGRMLAENLIQSFSAQARSIGVTMTVWLEDDLPGDLCVHLEYESRQEKNLTQHAIGLSIEHFLENYGLVTRRRLIPASGKDLNGSRE